MDRARRRAITVIKLCRQCIGASEIVMPLLIYALSALLAVAGDQSPVATAVRPADPSVAPAPVGKEGDSNAKQLTARQVLLAFALTNSASPRLWALAWLLSEENEHTSDTAKKRQGALLRKAAEAAPKDRLVQWMWSWAEPETSGCDAKSPCPDRASAYAMLESDNGAAWVRVFNAAWIANDVPAATSALLRIAQSPRFDEPIGDEFNAWKSYFSNSQPPQLDRRLTPYEKVETSPAGIALGEILEAPFPNYYLLVRACTRSKQSEASKERFKNCGKVGRLMLEHSNQFFGQVMGGTLIRLSGTADTKDVETARVMRWQFDRFFKLLNTMSTDASVFSDYLVDFEASGSDVESTRKAMQRMDTPLNPPADWQPTNSKGEPIDPLNQLLPPVKHP
jgi:hypothetical protein